MKKVIFGLAIFAGVYACKKDCNNINQTCKETPPKTEVCTAYFERWFYNEQTNKCEKKAYSGCSEYGFETESECKECECN